MKHQSLRTALNACGSALMIVGGLSACRDGVVQPRGGNADVAMPSRQALVWRRTLTRTDSGVTVTDSKHPGVVSLVQQVPSLGELSQFVIPRSYSAASRNSAETGLAPDRKPPAGARINPTSYTNREVCQRAVGRSIKKQPDGTTLVIAEDLTAKGGEPPQRYMLMRNGKVLRAVVVRHRKVKGNWVISGGLMNEYDPEGGWKKTEEFMLSEPQVASIGVRLQRGVVSAFSTLVDAVLPQKAHAQSEADAAWRDCVEATAAVAVDLLKFPDIDWVEYGAHSNLQTYYCEIADRLKPLRLPDVSVTMTCETIWTLEEWWIRDDANGEDLLVASWWVSTVSCRIM